MNTDVTRRDFIKTTALSAISTLIDTNMARAKAPGALLLPKSRGVNTISRICVTEWSAYYPNPLSSFLKRFDYYNALGVDMIRLETGWLTHPPLIDALKRYPFKIKYILYVLGIPKAYSDKYPNERMVDEHGVADWHLGPWSIDFSETTLQAGKAQLEKLAASGLAAHVKEMVVDCGPAGEGIYPANWTLNRQGEEAYWCYSDQAQASFRSAMRKRYGNIDSANTAWKLTGAQRFASWAEVLIPKPRTEWARGSFWNDMLIWYRDSKRKMLLKRIEQTQSMAKEYLGKDAKCIVYLPGAAYTQTDWDEAVTDASGPASIRLMMDNDWLMKTAISKGCILQYTGAENVNEVRNIVRKLQAIGSDAYKYMWGENAGSESAGRNPIWLGEVVTNCGIRGVDYTWSNWLFESDGVTPSKTYKPFEYMVKMIRTFHSTGRMLPPYLKDNVIHLTAPGKWTLDCYESTRIMSSYPDALKATDPEMAVVEGGQTQRILLKFPLEALPKGLKILSARLVLRRYLNYHLNITAPLAIYRITQPWQAICATWREADLGAPWSRRGGTAEDLNGHPFQDNIQLKPWAITEVPPYTVLGAKVEWDVTNLARKLLEGPDYGMMITVAGDHSCNKSFISTAYNDPSMRPILLVETTSS